MVLLASRCRLLGASIFQPGTGDALDICLGSQEGGDPFHQGPGGRCRLCLNEKLDWLPGGAVEAGFWR